MIKLVIFDLDGTLVNTLEDLKNAINIALKNKNYPFKYTLEETKGLIGCGTKVLCKRAISSLNPSEDMWKDLFLEFSKQYNLHQLDNARPYEGVNETINALHKLGIKCAVLSNKVDANSKMIINTLFKENTFDYVLGQLENMPLKPNPCGLNKVIDYFKLNKDEVLYVGDSDTDMETARNGEVKVCAVTYGYREKSLLESYNPDFMINSIYELIKIVNLIND